MKNIGSSICDAIDWTQDLLLVTRPVAEQTLFSLMEDSKVVETEDGYILLEDDEEELHRRKNVVVQKKMNNMRHTTIRRRGMRQRMKMDSNEFAQEMHKNFKKKSSDEDEE